MAARKTTKKTTPKAAPEATEKKPTTRPCLCGCGRTTKRGIAPGHDARMATWLRMRACGVDPIEKTPDGWAVVDAKRVDAVVAAAGKEKALSTVYFEAAKAGQPPISEALRKKARRVAS